MSNLYGYSDYDGPKTDFDKREEVQVPSKPFVDENDGDEDDDPLRSGLWMEGDSLAPPCGSSIPLIHSLLKFASISSDDILYDFGCGDGRVCLEALVQRNCCRCVGVEIEQDLVEKSHRLISQLPDSYKELSDGAPRIQVIHADLRDVIQELVTRGGTPDNEQPKLDQMRPFQKLPMPTIINLYLLPEAIMELEKDLISLLQYARIVCNTWGLPNVKHSAAIEIPESGGASTCLFLYSRKNIGKIDLP